MWKPIILDVECIVCNKSLQKINHDPRHATQNMGKITNRRSRTPNWSLDEKQYLLELIKERKEVVVTKSNNGPNHSEEKDVAWNEILRELSIKFGNKFSSSSIKKVKTQWQNMKRIAREEISLNGTEVQKYSRQSMEVCNILDLIKDGVLRKDNENMNETTMTTDIQIKTECIEDDSNEELSTCCDNNNAMETEQEEQQNNASIQFESSTSSVSDQILEANDSEPQEEVHLSKTTKKTAAVMTDIPYKQKETNINPFHRELQEFFRYTAAEKQLKMETLKEERHVVKAMRETAELNKIIAEQKLKHVLWIKKQEMSMYAGEPGSGAGKGGGGGGSIREAGGAFGKMEAAREDEYFYKKQKEQLANLKTHLDKEISFHQEQIKRHEDAIRRHKQQQADMEKK